MKPITGHTQLTALLGSPVSHSFSPMMHNTAFAHLDLDYAYLAFDVNEDTLKTVVDGLRSMNIAGFNLTMPVKTKMCQYCDELSPAAKIMEAVNTVVHKNGKFIGYSTDGIGYLRALQDIDFYIKGKKLTLLGAGGAATSILVQSALEGAREISIFSRPGVRFERTRAIIEQLKSYSDCKINLFDYNDDTILKSEIASSDLLTNATSVGMAPNTESSLITDPSVFRSDLVVSDIIYNPQETMFLRLAREAGCKTQNGLPMLLYQGAESFRLWTGHDMPIDFIKETVFSTK